MLDEILMLPDVAVLLKVAEKTVYTMAQRAEIPAFKVRGQQRSKWVDLDSWVEAQKASLSPVMVQNEARSAGATAARSVSASNFDPLYLLSDRPLRGSGRRGN